MVKLSPPVSKSDHTRGRISSGVVLVEYGDYECPFCGKAYYVLKELFRTKKDKIGYSFRNFPLVDVHPNALQAAIAAEAAAMQGKFWPMHEKIYENQSLLQEKYLLRYADEVGLDQHKFLHDIASEEAMSKVEDDIQNGVTSGVEGTPAFFINNVPYSGPYDLGVLTVVIDQLLAGTHYETGKGNYKLSHTTR